MVKQTQAAMDTELAGNVTRLVTGIIITRLDLQVFRFTSNTRDVKIDISDGSGPQSYIANEGYSRTNIQNDSELNIDNMDIVGIFGGAQLTELDLRRGLFDFADVKLFTFNYNDLSTTMGIVKMFRGQLGEIRITELGFFNVELRSIVQVFDRELGEVYTKDCRADLGDARCKIPILPPILLRGATVVLDEFYRVQTNPVPGLDEVTIIIPGDTDADAKSPLYPITGELGSKAKVQTIVKQFGAGAIEFSPSAPDDPSDAFVSYLDSDVIHIGTKEFNIELWVRFKDLSDSQQTFASQWLNTGDERSWYFRRNSGNLQFTFTENGSSFNTRSGAFAWAIDTWYHVAVSRDASDDIRMFVAGTQVGSTDNDNGDIFNSAGLFHLGKLKDAGDDDPLNGFIDDFEMRVGTSVRVANYTPPVLKLEPFSVKVNCRLPLFLLKYHERSSPVFNH